MLMATVIGISGHKYNGKDTCADYLVRQYGFNKLSFADPLKHAVQEIFGFTNQQLWGYEKETFDDYWGTTPRELLQYIGTDLFRNGLKYRFTKISDKVWLMALRKQVMKAEKMGLDRIVIPDVRFPNESNLIHDAFDGQVIKVIRDDLPSIDMHVSERCVDEIVEDYTIHNHTFLQLYADLDYYMAKLNIHKIIQIPIIKEIPKPKLLYSHM